MQLRQLEYTVAVVDAGSFTEAAKTLHVTQSALSQGVAALERELGADLFVRRRGETSLTAAGEAFTDAARRVLRDVRVARDSVDAIVGIAGGHLDLVVAPAFAAGPLGGVLGRFRTRHPRVSLRIESAEDTASIQEELVKGRAELGFGQLPVDETMQVIRTWTEEIWLVRPPGTSVADGPADLKDHLDAPLVVPRGAADQIRRVWHEAGLEADIAVECAAHELVLPLVLAGAGIAFQPASVGLAAAALGAGAQPLRPSVTWNTALFAPAGMALSPAAQAFVDVVRRG
ncbi:MAG: LysR family transcriptional regulator [Acidimicrobiia bacterium]|nr:LysR family transcriptional regulator [Acidimicrobiia bacterium]